MTIGEAVKLIRLDRELSVAEFARRAGVCYNAIHHVESGRARPTAKVLAAIRATYGYCPQALVVLSDPAADLEQHRALLAKHVKASKVT